MSAGFARFGPGPRYTIPEGGFCISSFAILRKRGKVLLVKPSRHEKWLQEWAPDLGIFEGERLEKQLRSWRFPSTYVKQGEAPDDALRRVVRDQLDVKAYAVTSSRFYNFYDPSTFFPGKMHWDYCFVYGISAPGEVHSKPWFSAVEYVQVSKLRPEDFGSAQGDLAKALRLM